MQQNEGVNLHQDVERYRAQWEANAKIDALWAVLTLDGKVGGGWDEAALFATGEQEMAEVFRFMGERQIALEAAHALDFGCGVGRLTRALASRVRSVVGVDISHEMIAQARQASPGLAFHLNEKDDLGDFSSASFELVYTNIVLQHLNNGLQQHYIREFSRILAPGGLAIVQIPSRAPRGSRKLRLLKMLAALRPRSAAVLIKKATAQRVFPWQAKMELNLLTKDAARRCADQSGFGVEAIANINWKVFYTEGRFQLEPEDNELADQPEFPLSHLYFFRRRG